MKYTRGWTQPGNLIGILVDNTGIKKPVLQQTAYLYRLSYRDTLSKLGSGCNYAVAIPAVKTALCPQLSAGLTRMSITHCTPAILIKSNDPGCSMVQRTRLVTIRSILRLTSTVNFHETQMVFEIMPREFLYFRHFWVDQITLSRHPPFNSLFFELYETYIVIKEQRGSDFKLDSIRSEPYIS